MRLPLRTVAGLGAALLATVGLVVQGCQDQTAMEALGPDMASAVLRVLKVSGGGTGSGSITAPAVGGAPALDCAVSAGTYDPDECTLRYANNTSVPLTATPSVGSRFKEWRNACTGTNPSCTVRMSENKAVRAVFQRTTTSTFRLSLTGAGTGDGSVTSQAGLSPQISCNLDGGSASGTCSATYSSGTTVTLTAAPASGHTFTGWSGDCTGSGTCTLAISANRSATASFLAPPGTEAEVGRWSAPQNTPVVGIHLSLLRNGNALLWGHGGEAQVWNAQGGNFTQMANAVCQDPEGCEVFCAGHTTLADGRVLVAGGHDEARGNSYGLTQSSTFDIQGGWQPSGRMRYARWYPTLVTLEDGKVVALSGSQTPGVNASIPERWDGSGWTELSGALQKLPNYPRAFVEPRNGRVFVAGHLEVRVLDHGGNGSWSLGPQRHVADRSYGSAVMLDSKVLYAGGGARACPGSPERSAEIIDLADASPSWSATGSMAFARRQMNLTILPDGSALATGGTSTCGPSDEGGAVFAAELWNPATGQWKTLASASVVRVYHSTAMLLPDGRVLSTGSGDGGGVTPRLSYEIFSPPYLFKGDRPSYDLTSTDMRYGVSFAASTSDAASIRKVTIIRLPSTTHAVDMSQRLNTLRFEVSAGGLTITPPASGRVAPPGPYMLFLVNEAGVPSVAQIVNLSG